MRILFLTAWFPYPPESGATIKTLSILNHLQKRHEVTLVCLRRGNLSEEQSRWAIEFGKVWSAPVNRGRNVLNLLRSYRSGVPLSVERNHSDLMAVAVSEATTGDSYDAIFIDGWLVAQYLPLPFGGLKLLHQHNAEYLIWRRSALSAPNSLLRPLLGFEASRVQRYETSMLRRFNVVFAVSQPDRQALIDIGGYADRVRVLPNLPDPDLLEKPALSFAEGEPVILYFGTLSWEPNIEGLRYFLTSVWPLIHGRNPDARFVIAGQGAAPSLKRLARETEGVDFLGPVDDPESLYSRARVFVETTRSGGGTKLKVLNALARGMPVVATRDAIEGIDAAPGQHLFVGDDPPSLADAIEFLLTDADLCMRLSEAGRELIRESYVAEVAFGDLDEVLDAREHV